MSDLILSESLPFLKETAEATWERLFNTAMAQGNLSPVSSVITFADAFLRQMYEVKVVYQIHVEMIPYRNGDSLWYRKKVKDITAQKIWYSIFTGEWKKADISVPRDIHNKLRSVVLAQGN